MDDDLVVQRCQAAVADWESTLATARTEVAFLKSRIPGWLALASIAVTQGLAHVRGLAANLQVKLTADPQRECLAHRLVVIDDQDPGLVV
jgi:hypothetical protein